MIFVFAPIGFTNAQVAELADALDSGSSAGNGVEVRILSWADPLARRVQAGSKCTRRALNGASDLFTKRNSTASLKSGGTPN
jgi:hypothetical protein